MKRFLLLALLATNLHAAEPTMIVDWDNPTELVDGTLVKDGDLINAVVTITNTDTDNVYVKEAPGAVPPVEFTGYESGNYDVSVIVVNNQGRESQPGLATITYLAEPKEPTNINAIIRITTTVELQQ